MRVILERSNLLKSLNHVHRVVERRNTIPILSNVLLNADGASLEMKATDLDLEITEATPANIEQAGSTTVPAHLLYEIVRKLSDGAEVMLKTDESGSSMSVISGRSNFKLQCLPQSDFPQLALRAVATDGHRLARAEVEAPAGSEGMPGIIIPRKTVSELQKLVDDPDVAVTIELSDTKIRFTIGSVVLTSKLIDGTFPDYERVIPTGNDKKLVIDRQSFAAAVDRVSTISSERGRAVKMSIAEGQVTLVVNNPDSGSATEEVAADYSSDPIDIGFNAKYLLDVAAQLTGGEATFMLADAGAPTLIQDPADERTLYVLMPMRV